MDQTSQLIAAIGVLWSVLTGLGAGVIRWLVQDRKECDESWERRLSKVETDWATRVGELESKLQEASDVVRRQSESLQKQVDAQRELVASQNQFIASLQSLRSRGQEE